MNFSADSGSEASKINATAKTATMFRQNNFISQLQLPVYWKPNQLQYE